MDQSVVILPDEEAARRAVERLAAEGMLREYITLSMQDKDREVTLAANLGVRSHAGQARATPGDLVRGALVGLILGGLLGLALVAGFASPLVPSHRVGFLFTVVWMAWTWLSVTGLAALLLFPVFYRTPAKKADPDLQRGEVALAVRRGTNREAGSASWWRGLGGESWEQRRGRAAPAAGMALPGETSMELGLLEGWGPRRGTYAAGARPGAGSYHCSGCNRVLRLREGETVPVCPCGNSTFTTH